MGQIVVALAEREQVNSIVALLQHEESIFGAVNREEVFDAMKEGRILVAMFGRLVLGMLEYSQSDSKTWRIDKVVVPYPIRRRHVGSLLVSDLCNEARSIGMSVIALVSAIDNSALNFFHEQGFKVTGMMKVGQRKGYALRKAVWND